MKALICRQWSSPEQLELGELESRAPGSGEVRLAVHACGINFADGLIIAGKYQERPELPFAPGIEVSGEVLEVGEGVTGLAPGQRVIALCAQGGLAEEACVRADGVAVIPDAMSFETAAGFGVTYGTSHVGLTRRCNLRAGETLLVHGAAGGVGLAAVEIGKALGATVIATASTEDKLALARKHGADHLIDYSDGQFRDQVKALTGGRGADVIYDPVGGWVFDQSLRCIAWEGRLLVIGFASGEIPKAPANLALVKNISIVGLFWGAYQYNDPDVIARSWGELLVWYSEGRIAPHVSQTFPLAEGGKAITSVMNREARGKVVVAVR